MSYNPGPYPLDDVIETAVAFIRKGNYITVKNAKNRYKKSSSAPSAKWIKSYIETGESPPGRNIDDERVDVSYWDIEGIRELLNWPTDTVESEDVGQVIGTSFRYLTFDETDTSFLANRPYLPNEIGDTVPIMRVTIKWVSAVVTKTWRGQRITALTDDGYVVVWFAPINSLRDNVSAEARLELHDSKVRGKSQYDDIATTRIAFRYSVRLTPTT